MNDNLEVTMIEQQECRTCGRPFQAVHSAQKCCQKAACKADEITQLYADLAVTYEQGWHDGYAKARNEG